ncbi:dTDP-4-dehydrorhamnose reductase [Bosea sp. PAMC 26642]|uniref:dTDP-4-dehydrorhamnose reductase n=1 Tax=Bosea sp. (strain PAMC 26642) TaxID=1792307 RepID=UPI0007701483|nr:dTDP-4-dehydrorhamnose reductase [Bosea sp. PAMC 26642]AMJ61029.1 dTDP-4-dehydrorhamnose reductase [Bosea sp. PAMC 26642]AMJ62727.1 dTDP-4-dehydrorhamnose reductase [Bosea sp. PAMC 26642]
MRVVVTGQNGQVALALAERAAASGIDLVALGRPAFDLERLETIAPALTAAKPDVIVNAAAYTAVDLAESESGTAHRVNAEAAGIVAATAARLGVPVIQISTDYVFDGSLDRPYREDDRTGPVSAYGRSKLGGEQAVIAATDNHAILRTAWVYSPFGKNFVRTMLRLGADRDEVGVVADQAGSPTNALDIADAVLGVARNLVERPGDPALRGIFHMAAQGEAVWADVAETVFAVATAAGRTPVRVTRIATRDYPTPARRPANSRLDSSKLAQAHGVALPEWRGSLRACAERLIAAEQTGRIS